MREAGPLSVREAPEVHWLQAAASTHHQQCQLLGKVSPDEVSKAATLVFAGHAAKALRAARLGLHSKARRGGKGRLASRQRRSLAPHI